MGFPLCHRLIDRTVLFFHVVLYLVETCAFAKRV